MEGEDRFESVEIMTGNKPTDKLRGREGELVKRS